MNTDLFINQFNQAHPFFVNFSGMEKAAYWIYNHPAIVKTVEISGMCLGAAACLILSPAVFKASKLGAVACALIGALTAAVTFVAYKVLDIVVAPHHSMETHVFTPAVFKAGRLYYQGNTPILELQSDDPYEAGLAHGYLMGRPLDDLLGQLKFIKRLAGMPEAQQIPKTLQSIREKLLPEHLRELEGLVAGYKQWSQEHKWSKQEVTVDDLILFHLMPDSLHFRPADVEPRLKDEQKKPDENPLGCTVVIDQDEKEGMVFGRNMDWPSFGVFGRYSLVINRKYAGQKFSTAEIGMPGFVGTLTGMNEHGFSLAMNVCSGNSGSVRGVPAAFFNRACLESCQSVQEATDKIGLESPLGSYHLNTADAQGAKSFHFYQGSGNDLHVVREWQAGQPLITTNCKYTSGGRKTAHMHCSAEREKIIQDLFDGAAAQVQADALQKAKLVEASLTLPHVNNSITTHTVVMYPQAMKMKAAFDNAYSAKAPLREIDLEPLFE